MALQIGKGHIHGLTGLSYTGTGLTVLPNLQTLRISHDSEAEEIKGMNGEVNSLICSNETLEMTIDAIPEGATTQALARTSMKIPAAPAGITLAFTGEAIVLGVFDDALNGIWIYKGGGSITGSNDAKWVMTLPLKRYVAINSATLIS